MPREGERRNSTRTTSYEFVLLQIKTQVTKFMALLEYEDMRSLVVELLSSVSLDATGRTAR
jgi:hypothetical protein